MTAGAGTAGIAPDDAKTAVPFPRALERFPRIRQSLASTFDCCPLQAKFDLLYRSGWNSHPAGRGTLSHRTIARALRLMVEHNEPACPVDIVLEEFDEVQRQHDVEMQASAASMRDQVVVVPLREIAEARVTVRTWAMHFRVDPATIAGVEKRLSATLTYPDGAGGVVERVVTGQLDLLRFFGTTAVVNDWKDTWGIPAEGKGGTVSIEDDGPPSGGNVSIEGYFQQRRYALLTFLTYPRIKRVVLEETYPRYLSGEVLDRKGEKINPIRRAIVERHQLPEIVREMSALVERLDRAVETDVWPASAGKHCRWCPRPSRCPIPDEVRDDGAITSQEHAETLAGAQQVLRRRVTSITKALKTWADNNGDVVVKVDDPKTDKVYGAVVRTETRKPSAEQVRDAHERGEDPSALFVTREKAVFCLHRPEEVHPFEQAVRDEEAALAAQQRGTA